MSCEFAEGYKVRDQVAMHSAVVGVLGQPQEHQQWRKTFTSQTINKLI